MENGFNSTWGIVELMGRNVIAGMLSEQPIAGSAFLRVDVPEVDGRAAFTKWFQGAAIYAITPTDETTARHAAKSIKTRPVELWIVPDKPLLPPVQNRSEDDDFEERDDRYDDNEYDMHIRYGEDEDFDTEGLPF